jgi:mono/diheme cytochrome c family protein
MKKKLIISLTLLALTITACGGQATQTRPEPAAPTQAVTQPTPVSTSASAATDTTVPTTEATDEPATQAPVAGVSFANDVLPILVNSCNDCHGVKQTKEGLDMRTYESLVAGSFNGTVLVAGNSADSFLVQQVVEGKMPKRGPKLTPEQIKIISDWIDAGALNN